MCIFMRISPQKFNLLAFGEPTYPTIVGSTKSQIPIKNIKSTNKNLLKQKINKPTHKMDLSGRQIKLRKTRSFRNLVNIFG